MLTMEWKARREMMTEIDPAEMILSPGNQQCDDSALIVGMEMMTIWTSLNWSEMESIEHRNMDIIMEELGIMLKDNCMEVDVEDAWNEI